MRAEVRHLLRLVDDLRTLSLADASELSLQRQTVAPGVLLTHVVAAFRHQAEQAGIRLGVEVESGLPEARLDPGRMELVLRNLVDNALGHTPAGGEVGLRAGRHADGPALIVQDTGMGIAPDGLAHVFDRSYRGDPSRSGNELGLGLTIAK